MVIIMILTILCIVGLGVSAGLAINNCIDKQKSKFKKKIVWILLFTALSLTFVLTMYHGSTDHIGDGQKVAVIYEENSTEQYPLYYSERHDEYFVILTNLYNPIDLAERHIIDKETAKRYVELYNELHSINMKGTVK